MKKMLLALMVLTSFSGFAGECKLRGSYSAPGIIYPWWVKHDVSLETVDKEDCVAAARELFDYSSEATLSSGYRVKVSIKKVKLSYTDVDGTVSIVLKK